MQPNLIEWRAWEAGHAQAMQWRAVAGCGKVEYPVPHWRTGARGRRNTGTHSEELGHRESWAHTGKQSPDRARVQVCRRDGRNQLAGRWQATTDPAAADATPECSRAATGIQSAVHERGARERARASAVRFRFWVHFRGGEAEWLAHKPRVWCGGSADYLGSSQRRLFCRQGHAFSSPPTLAGGGCQGSA